MAHDLAALADQLLSAARVAGADTADTLVVQGTALTLDVRGGALEQAERSEGVDLGLRVMIGQKQACVSASDTSANAIAAMAERAVAMAQIAPDDPWIGLADSQQLSSVRDAAGLDLYDPNDEPAPDALKDAALEAEAAALAVDGVAQTQGASATYGARNVWLATSDGFAGGYHRTDNAVSCVAIAGEGNAMERDSDGDYRVHRSDLRSPTQIGTRAGERAVAGLNARKPPKGQVPVLFDERVSASIIGHIMGAVSGAAVARGGSWLRDALGTQILPQNLTLTEDPLRPRVPGSRPFDAEGLRAKPRDIIADGVLTGWTLDLAHARQLGIEPTANAARGTGGPPGPSVTNLALTGSDKTREDLISDMGTGLLLTSLIGSSINPNTGDYSRGGSGFWVENGEITYAVNELTLAGNLHDMIRNMVAANDGRAWTSRVVPSLLIDGLTIA